MDPVILERDKLQHLFQIIKAHGYLIIGPRLEQGAIVYAPLSNPADLPVGWLDEQSAGHYRLRRAPADSLDARALFRYTVGPHSWKPYLFPPEQLLWRATREHKGFTIQAQEAASARQAFFGVRACELAAMMIQDRVFDNGQYADPDYRRRREQALVVAVNCTRASSSCFCVSTRTGPAAREAYDLCLTELLDLTGHRFLLQVGSERGQAIVADLSHRPARSAEVEQAQQLLERTAAAMGRELHPDAAAILERNPEHSHWQEVAGRCLGCSNCTLVCPTCFCSTVEDHTSLDGSRAERTRRWDSCFSLEFSYIHGGSIRRDGAARYRQWISHKLSTWHAQFGSSGCTGCGRCITWCPVGIDLTEEVAAIHATEEGI